MTAASAADAPGVLLGAAPLPAEMAPSSFARSRAPDGQTAGAKAGPTLAAEPASSMALVLTSPSSASYAAPDAGLVGATGPAEPPISESDNALGADVAAAPLPSCPPGEHFSIPIPWGEPSFETFRNAYLTEGGRKWLAAVMKRASPYMAYIAERVRYYGLPDELVYLPVIESEFSPKAVSKSGATGLWQFMRNSIGGYGIRIDDWVDERRDFMKSTDAALRKLADNYAAFGDWNLALAAYNSGLGAVTRALKKADPDKGRDYWSLRKQGLLAAETTSYVPKFLAVVTILSYPRNNGLEVGWDEGSAWESLELRKSVDLCLLADASGIPLADLKAGNAELRYTVTPPWSGYRIKVPAGSADAVKAALDDPSLKLLRYYLHKVRSGDTLSAIARHYGTPQPMIVQANPGMKPDLLRLGQVIVIPALKEAAPMEVAASDDAKLDFSGSYSVARGDTLWSISLRYDVQPEVLAEKNGLSLTSVIREGMVLRVPIIK
jgi:membrane-bound lytic murein transglycosylase D